MARLTERSMQGLRKIHHLWMAQRAVATQGPLDHVPTPATPRAEARAQRRILGHDLRKQQQVGVRSVGRQKRRTPGEQLEQDRRRAVNVDSFVDFTTLRFFCSGAM